MKRPSSQRAAFSLVEALVAMAVLMLILTVAGATILAAFRTYHSDSAQFDRMLAQNNLADRLRADVAGALSAPEKLGEDRAGAAQLLLRRADDKVIIYRIQDRQVVREVLGGAASPLKQVFPTGGDHARLSFHRSCKDKRLITLRWTQPVGPQSAAVPRTVEFSAALGGDLR